MQTPPQDAAVPVSQEDRDAAASLIRAGRASLKELVAHDMEQGRDDDGHIVQAFARHAQSARLAERQAGAERERVLREALEPFADIAVGEVWERFTADSKMSLRISNGAGDRHYTFINAECFQGACAALERNPSDGQ